jgi:hypothetical protein
VASRYHFSTGKFLDVAPASECLHGLLAGANGDLRGLELRHRAFGVLERHALSCHPSGAPRQQPRGVDVRREIGERKRHARWTRGQGEPATGKVSGSCCFDHLPKFL